MKICKAINISWEVAKEEIMKEIVIYKEEEKKRIKKRRDVRRG